MENDNILKVENLSISLDNEEIFNNFSFEVKKGEFLTILGPNGSGKTVLLRTLLGFLPIKSGRVVWSDDARIGYLPQGLTHLKVKNIPLSVEEFLALKKIKTEKMLNLFSLLGVRDENILKKRIGNLSGGQFQRMLMVWALAHDPNVLLFDEPTTGIDVHGEKSVYDLLHKLQKEKNITIILITHDFNIIYTYSTNVVCASRNNACHGKPTEILSPDKLEEIYGMPIKFYKHKH